MSNTTPPTSAPPGGSAGADDTDRRRCSAIARGGGRCKRPPLPDSDVCGFHSADSASRERLCAMSKAGGRARAARAAAERAAASVLVPPVAAVVNLDALDLKTPCDVLNLLAGTLRQLAQLPFGIRVAHAIGQVASVVLRGHEVYELDERLRVLEAAGSHPSAQRRSSWRLAQQTD